MNNYYAIYTYIYIQGRCLELRGQIRILLAGPMLYKSKNLFMFIFRVVCSLKKTHQMLDMKFFKNNMKVLCKKYGNHSHTAYT